ncbi:MAG: hypothetical protein ABIU05_19765 [Nitrospirales bacterium]
MTTHVGGYHAKFLCGLIVGLTLAGAVGYAGQFYDSHGQQVAPSGSVQQFDYFRRQLFLNAEATRRDTEETARYNKLHPCGR